MGERPSVHVYERADDGALLDLSRLADSLDHSRVGAHGGVPQEAPRTDARPCTDAGSAFKLGGLRDAHASLDLHVDVDPRARWIDDGHAGGHPARQQPLIEYAPRSGELCLVVHALDLVEVRTECARNVVAIGTQDGWNLSEVLLAGRFGRGNPLDRVGEQVAIKREHARADLRDRPLSGRGVSFLHDAGDLAVPVPQYPAVALRVRRLRGEDRHSRAGGLLLADQAGQRLYTQQRRV